MTYLAEKLKHALIKSEIARRGVADAETVEMILESLSMVNDEGDIVSRDGGRSLETMFDNLQKTNPEYFTAPKATAPRVIIDPSAPGFSLSRAFAEARNDPDLHAELLARLAPRPMTPGATR